jgi:hypothetical protein
MNWDRQSLELCNLAMSILKLTQLADNCDDEIVSFEAASRLLAQQQQPATKL